MTPGTVTLQAFTRGDPWRGTGNITITDGERAGGTTLTSVLVHFRKKATADLALSLSSAEASEILITDAANWIFMFPKQAMALEVGVFVWDVELTGSDTWTETYAGGTITVAQDTTDLARV